MATPVTGRRTQRFLLAPETVYGTAISIVDTKLNALRVAVQDMIDVEAFAPQGDAAPSIVSVNDESTQLVFTGKMSFTDLCYVFSSLFGEITPTNPGGAAYLWTWDWDATEVVSPLSYTVTYGDVNFAKRVAGVLFNTLSFSIDRSGNLTMTSNAFGKKLETGIVSYPRESSFTLTITASGGTYTITWAGQTTASIAFDANAATILAALVALPNVAAGDLTVTGTGPFVIKGTNTGAFAATDVTASVGTGSLTGGSATLVETQAGGPISSVVAVPMFPLQFDVFMDDDWASIGNTQVGSIFAFNLGIDPRWSRTRPIDSSLDSDGFTEAEGDDSGQNHTLGFTIAADANGEAVLADAQAGTVKFFRVEATGAANSIDSGHAYEFRWDFAYFITDIGEFGSTQGGVHAIPFTGRIAKDQTTGNSQHIELQNGLSAL